MVLSTFFSVKFCRCNYVHLSTMSQNPKSNDWRDNYYGNDYPPGNYHIPPKWHFEDEFPFPKVGYVNFLEGISYSHAVGFCVARSKFGGVDVWSCFSNLLIVEKALEV